MPHHMGVKDKGKRGTYVACCELESTEYVLTKEIQLMLPVPFCTDGEGDESLPRELGRQCKGEAKNLGLRARSPG